MTENVQNQPIMDGATEATDDEKRKGLAEQVESDHEGDTEASKSDDLDTRLEETGLTENSDSTTETESVTSSDTTERIHPVD